MRYIAMHVRLPDGDSAWYVVDRIMRRRGRLGAREDRSEIEAAACNSNLRGNEYPIREREWQRELLRRAK